MNLKKKLRKFFTLTRTADAGFTLVELIVVIAILAILAGVGTVGYSGYIKNANKNADKVLVGNIMRAIETGTNSTMFELPESMDLSATTFPVGFIVLSSNGTQVVTSMSNTVDPSAACEFVQEEIRVIESDLSVIQGSDCSHTTTKTIYVDRGTISIRYCKTHSVNMPTVLSSNAKYITGYSYTKGRYLGCLSHNTNEVSNVTVNSGTLVATDISGLFTEVSGTGVCEYADNPSLNYVATVNTNNANDKLYQAILAAFGGTDMALKYDGWVADSNQDFNYATYYSYAPSLIGDVKGFANALITATQSDTVVMGALELGYDLRNDYLTDGAYEDSTDLMSSFSDFISTQYTPAQWDAEWASAGASNTDEYSFKVGTHGGKNDFILAARMAYNSAFVSYCVANGYDDETYGEYNDIIINYGDQVSFLSVNIPSIANKGAFAKTGEGSLLEQFKSVDATNGEVIFGQYKALFEKYILSTACEENGRAFYNTVKTVSDTKNVAGSTGNTEDFFTYYTNYMKEMANLLEKAQTMSNEGIIIIVEVDKGEMKCTVSPSAANPRND